MPLDLSVATPSSALLETSCATAFCIGGADEFLVYQEGKKYLEANTPELNTDEFSTEVIEGRAQNASQAELIVNNFAQAVATPPIFTNTKFVWLKNVNFLGDNVIGRSQIAKKAVDSLLNLLQTPCLLSPEFSILITASPVDRRTKAYKMLQKITRFQWVEDTPEALYAIATQEANKRKLVFEGNALKVLIEKVNACSRLLIQELNKLENYIGLSSEPVTEEFIHKFIPQFGEGDFFEMPEAFFSFDLGWTLDAIKRYFFLNKNDARPLLAALQNRNRLLLQLRSLLEQKMLPHALSKTSLQALAEKFNLNAFQKKSSFNLFVQNPWYLNKLLTIVRKKPIAFFLALQIELAELFEQILTFPGKEESLFSSLAFKFLR